MRKRSIQPLWLPLVASVLTGGTGIAWALSTSTQPDVYAPIGSAPAAVTEDPSASLETILEQYGGDLIVGASIGGPPEGFEPTDGTVPVPLGFEEGKWTYLLVRAPSESPAALRAVWEAELVNGALRDRLHASGAVLYGSRIALQLPDGRVVPDIGGGVGDVAFGQEFPTPPTPNAVRSAVESGLVLSGLQMTSLDILTPRQAAPAVVATSTAPAAFVRDSQEIIKRTFGVPPLYEGYYIEVRDSAGEAFFIQATDFRLGAGHQWIRADEQTKLRDHRAGSSTNPSTPIPTG